MYIFLLDDYGFRPLSEDEQRMNVPRVISCNEHKREVTVLQNVANKQVDRVFTFDKVKLQPKCYENTCHFSLHRFVEVHIFI